MTWFLWLIVIFFLWLLALMWGAGVLEARW